MISTSSSTDLEGIGYALYSLGEHLVTAAWIVGVGLIFVFFGLIFLAARQSQ